MHCTLHLLLALLIGLTFTACDDAETTPATDAGVSADLGATGGSGGAGGTGGSEPDAALSPGELQVESTTVDFGPSVIRGNSEAELSFTNAGETTLNITALQGLAAPFASARMPPISVPAGQTRRLVLTFSPEVAGPAEQTIELITDVPDAEPITITLSGTGVSPEGALDSDTLDFGVVAPGTPGGDFVQVLNTSDAAPLTISGFSGFEAPFLLPEGQLPVTAQPGETAQFLVQFAPEVDGDWSQTATINTNAGRFEITLTGRAISVGDLIVHGVEPAWAPVDQHTTVVIHGGPFDALPTAVRIGDIPLVDLQLIDAERVQGTLPADAQTPLGLLDVRVEQGATFGVAAGGFVRTPPVDSGQILDAAALAAPIGPAGNPWLLAIDTIPADTEAVLDPGTVILVNDRANLAINGSLRTSGEGLVIFSSALAMTGGWGGLHFADAAPASSLTDLVIEYAGAGDTSAITAEQATTFTRLRIHHAQADGLTIGATGTLVVLGGYFSDVGGAAMSVLTETGGLFRMQDTRVRNSGWPLRARARHLGDRPIGSGHDWAPNVFDGIALHNEIVGDARLSNQPAGVTYHLPDGLTIADGGHLTLSEAAPLRLDNTLTIAGTLTLPPSLVLTAEAGGLIIIGDGGTLSARGTIADVITIQARLDDIPTPGAWLGLELHPGGTFDAENLIIRDGGADGPMVKLMADFDVLRALQFEASDGFGLEIAGSGNIINARWNDNTAGSLRVTAGSGRITGLSTDATGAVFDPIELCADWELPAFRRPEGEDAPTNCPPAE